jgi:hypothetical protein
MTVSLCVAFLGGILLMASPSALAQTPCTGCWAVIGNNIYSPNTGSVGIGTSTPDYPLTVHALGDAFHIDSPSGNYTFCIRPAVRHRSI